MFGIFLSKGLVEILN